MTNEDKPLERVIAVGMDGSDSSWRALSEAILLARVKKAPLHIVSVQETVHASFSPSEVMAADKTEKGKLEEIQAKARKKAEEQGVDAQTAICVGHPAGAMVDYVKKNQITLLVVGDVGHANIWGALLGNTAEKIVHQSPCSVMVVR